MKKKNLNEQDLFKTQPLPKLLNKYYILLHMLREGVGYILYSPALNQSILQRSLRISLPGNVRNVLTRLIGFLISFLCLPFTLFNKHSKYKPKKEYTGNMHLHVTATRPEPTTT